MMPRSPTLLPLIVGLSLAFPGSLSLAADQGSKDQSRRMQQQLRAVQQEKSELSKRVTATESQLKEAETKLSESKKMADESAGKAARLSRELSGLRNQVESTRADRDQLAAKLADAERNLAELKRIHGAETAQLRDALARQQVQMASCAERNTKMYQLGNDLLDRYEGKHCFTALLQAEPFTGIKRAQIEKMVEEEREILDNQRLPQEVSRDRMSAAQ